MAESDPSTALAPRAPSRTSDQYGTPAADAALKSLESSMGGRQSLATALLAAPASDDLAYVIGLVGDPRNDARSLAALCKAGGITVGELLEAYKRGAYAPMQVKVIAAVATHTPAVVEDVLTRAQPHFVVCPACRGTLLVRDPKASSPLDAPKVPCEVCVNADNIPTGQLLQLPDLDRQKLALDLANLLPKKAPLVSQTIDARSVNMGDASPGGLAKLLEATDRILHGRGTTRAPLTVEVSDAPLADPDDADPVEPPD